MTIDLILLGATSVVTLLLHLMREPARHPLERQLAEAGFLPTGEMTWRRVENGVQIDVRTSGDDATIEARGDGPAPKLTLRVGVTRDDDLCIGDEVFEQQLRVGGDPHTALSLLKPATRKLLQSFAKPHRLSLKNGALLVSPTFFGEIDLETLQRVAESLFRPQSLTPQQRFDIETHSSVRVKLFTLALVRDGDVRLAKLPVLLHARVKRELVDVLRALPEADVPSSLRALRESSGGEVSTELGGAISVAKR